MTHEKVSRRDTILHPSRAIHQNRHPSKSPQDSVVGEKGVKFINDNRLFYTLYLNVVCHHPSSTREPLLYDLPTAFQYLTKPVIPEKEKRVIYLVSSPEESHIFVRFSKNHSHPPLIAIVFS